MLGSGDRKLRSAVFESGAFRAMVLIGIGFFIGLQSGLLYSHSNINDLQPPPQQAQTQTRDALTLQPPPPPTPAPAAPSPPPPPPPPPAPVPVRRPACDPNPCANGGRCVSLAIAASDSTVVACECAPGFRGVLCQFAIPPPPPPPPPPPAPLPAAPAVAAIPDPPLRALSEVLPGGCSAYCNWTYDGLAPGGMAFRNSLREYVCPTMFRDLSDYVYFWPFDHYTFEKAVIHDYKKIASCLRPGAIIYIQTLSWEGKPIHWFAEKFAPLLTQKFILITGEADEDPMREGLPILSSPNLLHWFAQHVPPNAHPKLEPIPLGLNCWEHAPELNQFLQARSKTAIAAAPPATAAPSSPLPPTPVLNPLLFPPHRIPPKLVVVNFDAGTHGSRRGIWQQFCGERPNNGAAVFAAKQAGGGDAPPAPEGRFADCPPKMVRNLMRRNSHLVGHYERMSEYKFWICPRGNGLDTHRAWEALYVGAVPIIKRSAGMEPLFNDGDLPVLLVDDYAQVTEAFLNEQWNTRFADWSRYPRRRLTRRYWIDRIATVRRYGLAGQPIPSATTPVAAPSRFYDTAPGYQCWGYQSPEPDA